MLCDDSPKLLHFVFPPRRGLVVRSDDAEPEEADAPMCIHELAEYITWHRKAGFVCNGCGAKFGDGLTLYGCRICDFDLCHKCFERERGVFKTEDGQLSGIIKYRNAFEVVKHWT